MIEQELYTHLKDNVASVSGRVYPMKMPQGATKPALVYTVIIDTDNQCLGGDVGSSDIRFQVDVYAESYAAAKTIKEEVKAVLYTFSHPVSGMTTQDGFVEGTELFRQIIDFSIRS